MHNPNALAIPAPIPEAPTVPEDLPDNCAICGHHVDPRNACAWSRGGKWVAHLRCYDECWFTVGVAEDLNAEASS